MDLWAVDRLNVNGGQVVLTFPEIIKTFTVQFSSLREGQDGKISEKFLFFSEGDCVTLTSKYQSYEYLKCA